MIVDVQNIEISPGDEAIVFPRRKTNFPAEIFKNLKKIFRKYKKNLQNSVSGDIVYVKYQILQKNQSKALWVWELPVRAERTEKWLSFPVVLLFMTPDT